MPYVQSPGGGTYNPEAGIVGVLTIDRTAPSNSTALTEQPRTIQGAADEGAVQVKSLPQVIRTVADLPTNAEPGMMFTSALNPTAIYVLCEDNVWRAFTLLPVA